MCPTGSNYDWLFQLLGCWLWFVSWWVWPVVIVTLRKINMLMAVSFLYNVPYADSGRMCHLQIIFHCLLGLSWCCLYFNSGQTSPPRVVCVLGVVVSASCNGTKRHRWRLESLGRCPYQEGYCFFIHSKLLIIDHNQLTWVGTFIKNAWWCCHRCPQCMSFWVPRVLWMCILLARMLICLPKTLGSRLLLFGCLELIRILF